MRNEMTQTLTWKKAILSTKGPDTFNSAVLLFIKGLFMGAANIIPGVSGGTIALITGIYQDLLFAIRSVNMDTFRYLKQRQFKQALATIHLKFLVVLCLGVGFAILTLAHVMNYVFINFPIFTWSFFFGLIIASILIMGLRTTKWLGSGGVSFIIGAVFAYVFVGLIPVSTPETWWFILLAGAVAICTMILPGLSGAFLLLIIGKYEFITAALKNPFAMDNFIILCIFGIGCLLGLVAFTRVLSFMLKNFENGTMALLTGIMLGSLRKVWPWKEVLETKMIRGKMHVINEANVLPDSFNTELVIAVALMIAGCILVILLERTAEN